MVRRTPDYDPDLTPIRSAARPLDLAVAFPNFQAARPRPFDLGEIAEVAGVIKRRVNTRQDQQEAVEEQQALDQATRVFEENKEELRKKDSEVNQKIARGEWPEMASRKAQKHLMVLQGVDGADTYEGIATREMAESAAVLDSNGNPKEIADWDSVKSRAWQKATGGLPAMKNEYGRLAALARKAEIDKKIDRQRNGMLAENEKQLRDALQGNKVGRAIRDWQNSSRDPADLRARVEKMEALSHSLGTLQSIKVTLSGINAESELMDREEAMETLAILRDAKVGGDSAVARDNYQAGIDEIERRVLSQARTDRRLHMDQQQSEAIRAKQDLNEKWYGVMLDESSKGVPMSQIEAAVRVDIEAVRADRPELARTLEDELQAMRSSVNRGTMNGDAQTFAGLSERIRQGVPIDADLGSDTIRRSLSPQQLRQLYADNAALKNVDAKLRGTTFAKTSRGLSTLVDEVFVGQGAEASHARSVLNKALRPKLDKFYEEARDRARTDDPAKLNDYFASQLTESGLAGAIQKEIVDYRTKRAAMLADLEPKIERGVNVRRILESEDAQKYLGDRLKQLSKDNKEKSDPSRFIGSGNEFDERWRDYRNRVLATIAPLPQDRGPEATRSAQSIATKAFAAFKIEFRKLVEGNDATDDIEEMAVGKLEEVTQEEIDKVFAAAVEAQKSQVKPGAR